MATTLGITSRHPPKMIAKEAGNTADSVKLYQSGKVMTLIRVNLDFVRNIVGFQHLFQLIRLRDWNGGVTGTMQDEYRRKLRCLISKVRRQTTKEFSHGGDPAVMCGKRNRQISAE